MLHHTVHVVTKSLRRLQTLRLWQFFYFWLCMKWKTAGTPAMVPALAVSTGSITYVFTLLRSSNISIPAKAENPPPPTLCMNQILRLSCFHHLQLWQKNLSISIFFPSPTVAKNPSKDCRTQFLILDNSKTELIPSEILSLVWFHHIFCVVCQLSHHHTPIPIYTGVCGRTRLNLILPPV